MYTLRWKSSGCVPGDSYANDDGTINPTQQGSGIVPGLKVDGCKPIPWWVIAAAVATVVVFGRK